VKYSNKNSINFLAVNRAHGWTDDVGTFQGLQIDLASLTAITIKPDKKSALFQGGVFGELVIKTLWDQGYVTSESSSNSSTKSASLQAY